MPPEAPANEPNAPRPRRRFRRWMAAGLVLLIALYLGRAWWAGPLVGHAVASMLHTETGAVIEVGSVRGNYFTSLELSDVVTRRPAPDQGLNDLAARRVSMRYSLLGLLRGADDWLGAVEIDQARLDVDLDRRPPHQAGSLPGVLPELTLQDTAVHLRSGRWRVDLVGTDATARSPERDDPAVHSQIELSARRVRLWDGETVRADVILGAAGEYDAGRLQVSRLAVNRHDLVRHLAVDLRELKQGRLQADATLEVAGGRLQTAVQKAADDWSGSLEVRGLDLALLQDLLQTQGPVLAGALDGSLEVSVPAADLDQLTVRADFSFGQGRLGDLERLALETHLELSQGRLQNTWLDVQQGDRHLRLQDLTMPATLSSVSLADATGVLDLDLTDLPDLARVAGMEWDPRWPQVRRAHGRARLLSNALQVEQLVVESPAGTLDVHDARLRLPVTTDLTAWSRWLRHELSLESEARIALRVPALASLTPRLDLPHLEGGVEITGLVSGHSKELAFDLDAVTTAISGQNAVWPESAVQARGRLLTQDRHLMLDELHLEQTYGRVVARAVDLPLAFEDPEWWRGARGQLSADSDDLIAWLSRFGLTTDPTPPWTARLHVEASLDAGEVRIPNASLLANTTQIHLQEGRSSLGPSARPLELAGVLRVQSEDLSDLSHLPGVPLLGGALQGHARVSGSLDRPALDADLEGVDLAVSGRPLGQLDLKGRLSGDDVVVERLLLSGSTGRIETRGTARWSPADRRFGLQLDQLVLTGRDHALKLRQPAHLSIAATGLVEVDDLTLEGVGGSGVLGGRFDPTGVSDLELVVRDLRPTDALRSWLPGAPRVDRIERLDLTVSGPLETLEAQLTLLARGASLGQQLPLDVDLDVHLSGQTLRVRHAHVQAGDERLIQASGTLPLALGERPFAEGPLDLQVQVNVQDAGRFTGDAAWMPAIPNLRGELTARGTWQRPDLLLRLDGTGVTHAALRRVYDGPWNTSVDAHLDGDTLRLRSFEASSSRGSLAVTGEVAGALDFTAFPRVHLDPKAAVTGSVAWELPDLSWLAERAPTIRSLQGAVTADLEVSGPVERPLLVGDLTVTDGQFRLAVAGIASMTDVQARARLEGMTLNMEGATLHLQDCRGELGASPFALAGSVSLDEARTPVLDLTLKGDELLLYRSRGVKIRANADLHVEGPLPGLRVGGVLDLTDGRQTRHLDLLGLLDDSTEFQEGLHLFSLTEPPLRDVRFDIQITCTNPYRVQSRLVQGGLRPELRLRGTGELPYLVGPVYLEPSLLALPLCTFRVDTGTIRFLENDPFHPRLDLSARTQTLGYAVQASITGPVDEPVIYLSSTPPLPQEDLLLLVVAGQLPDDRSGLSAGTRALGSVVVYLSRDLLERVLDDESTEGTESILNRFEYEAGGNLSRRGQETLQARFRILDDFLVERDSVYLEVERSEFDEYNGALRLVLRLR